MTTQPQPKQHDAKEDSAKREILKKPGKDDVHEQREPEQERAGTVHSPDGSAGGQSGGHPAKPTKR